MLTNDFGNSFLTRSLLQFRGKMGTPFLALQNELDGFALSFHAGKTHLPHLAPLPQPTHQLHPHQQPQFPPQHPTRNYHPLQFLHPSHYSLYPSHYPRMYAGAAAAAAAAAAAIEQSIPFSHHVMAVAPSLAKAFLPQSLSLKNPDTVGIGTLGIGFHRGSDNNNNENNNNSNINNNNSNTNKQVNDDSSHIGCQLSNSPTIENLPRVEDKMSVVNDKGTTRSIISQSIRTGTVGCIDVSNNSSNSNNNHNVRLLDSVGPANDPHRNMMFYQGREKSERGRKIFLCPQCHYVTDRKNNLKRHIITMHQDCPKILECCGVIFRSKAMLREHVSLFHSSGYRCRVCGRNFCRKALLRRHLSVHSGQKDFICPLCSYATSHKSNLERHQKVHNKKSTLNGIGVSSSGMKGLSEELSKVSVVAEVPENSFDHESPTSQVCTPTADTYLYRSPPIEAAIGIPRIKKFLLPDRLNQTYTDSSQRVDSDSVDSGKDIAIQVINDHEDHRMSNENYRYRHVYNSSNNNGDNYHLYTHHHHHHHHHHHINTTVTSLQMADNHQSSSSGKIIKRKPPRIFMTSYKCIDCRKVFSHQSLLNSHSCLNDQPKGDSYLSIVRPLAKKQPVKQIMTLASQRPTTSSAVVVVSTNVNNWRESINRYPLPSIQSQPQTPNESLEALTKEEMVMLSSKTSCFSDYSPALCSNTCDRSSLKLKSDQTMKNNSNDEFVMNVSNEEEDNNNSDTKEEVHHNDEKFASIDECVQMKSKCISRECLEMDIEGQIDERKQDKFNDRPGWCQQKDSDNTDCTMQEHGEDENEKDFEAHLKSDGKETTKEIMKEENSEGTELTPHLKVDEDVTDDDLDDNNYDELPLPFKKRPIKDNNSNEATDASWELCRKSPVENS